MLPWTLSPACFLFSAWVQGFSSVSELPLTISCMFFWGAGEGWKVEETKGMIYCRNASDGPVQ